MPQPEFTDLIIATKIEVKKYHGVPPSPGNPKEPFETVLRESRVIQRSYRDGRPTEFIPMED
jgi:hypothetical protein